MRKPLVFSAVAVGLLALAGILFWSTADDPEYLIKERVFAHRYKKYDFLIQQAAQRYQVPPELIKAVIWRESRFQPDKTGQQGERGLMQITERAATDWVRAEKIETFAPTDLFDPKVNIEAGTWYLKQALNHWSSRDDALPFALAEYNAGRSRVRRWVSNSGRGDTAGAGDMQAAMDFPTTKSYVAAILARYDFYKRRGEFEAAPSDK